MERRVNGHNIAYSGKRVTSQIHQPELHKIGILNGRQFSGVFAQHEASKLDCIHRLDIKTRHWSCKWQMGGTAITEKYFLCY